MVQNSKNEKKKKKIFDRNGNVNGHVSNSVEHDIHRYIVESHHIWNAIPKI